MRGGVGLALYCPYARAALRYIRKRFSGVPIAFSLEFLERFARRFCERFAGVVVKFRLGSESRSSFWRGNAAYAAR